MNIAGLSMEVTMKLRARKHICRILAIALIGLLIQDCMLVEAFATIGVTAGASKITTVSSNEKEPDRVIEIKVTEAEPKQSEADVDVKINVSADEASAGSMVMADVEDSLNVRAEASEDSELIGRLYKGTGGEVLEKTAAWTKFKSGNLVGWAKNEYLLFGTEAEEAARAATSVTATIETDSLRVRKEANEEAGVYGLLGVGDVVKVINESDEWIEIQYDDDTVGFIAAEYATVTSEMPTGETLEEIEAREEAERKAKEEEEQKAAEKAAAVAASRTTATTETNNGAITGDVNDVLLLAALIQCEAGYEVYEGQVAVGTVVMNRLRGGRYGASIYSVIYAKGQFGPAGTGKVAKVYAQGPKAICIQAAQEAMNGTSLIGTATHFRNIRSGYPGIVIGNHVFW
jgi:uncharacterized protein YgiM (DUF1202 family)